MGVEGTCSASPAARCWRSRRVPGMSSFQLMDDAKQAAKAKNIQVMDLSIGTPDMVPPKEALEALKAAVDDPSTYKYCLKSGTLPLLQAAVDWYGRTYGVTLDVHTEALSLIGSQEGLAHLLMAVADAGDGILTCDVAYPNYYGAFHVAGLTPHFMPLDPVTFLPDFARVLPAAAARCKAMLLNYPNNPTSATADNAFWRRALDFCEQHDLLLIHDNPYVGQDYACEAATSPLALLGAKRRTIELFSFAKSFQMGGFRLGFALGNAEVIAALEALKSPIDFAQYLGIQRMGIRCLELPVQRVRDYAAQWCRRAHALAGALAKIGWHVALPKACMYLWVKLPADLPDDMAFCLALVQHTGIALSPGRGFGPGGYGYVRFALVQPEDVLVAAAATIGAFVQGPVCDGLRARAAADAAAGAGGAAGEGAANVAPMEGPSGLVTGGGPGQKADGVHMDMGGASKAGAGGVGRAMIVVRAEGDSDVEGDQDWGMYEI